MHKSTESLAPTKNEPIMVFQFSETKSNVRTLMVDEKVYFVGSDVAKTLGYKEPHKAIQRHCRYGMKRPIPHPQNPEKEIMMLVIPEGDVFRLIVNSELPSAQAFESWVMDEVLPSIRKKGYYGTKSSQKCDFLDARDVPYYTHQVNSFPVRCINIDGVIWAVINDVNKAIHSSTGSIQTAKKLNIKSPMAQKIWLFGNTHPCWCTNELGVNLILSGSRKLQTNKMVLFGEGGAA